MSFRVPFNTVLGCLKNTSAKFAPSAPKPQSVIPVDRIYEASGSAESEVGMEEPHSHGIGLELDETRPFQGIVAAHPTPFAFLASAAAESSVAVCAGESIGNE
jgi:hypothetical protein